MASETITTTSGDEPVVEQPVIEQDATVVDDIDETESLEETPAEEEQPVVEDDSDDGWDGYAKEHGLDYKSPEELIAAHKALLESQRTPQREHEPEPQPRQAPAQQPTDKQQSFYNYSPGKALIENWKAQGFMNDEVGKQYEAVANFVDNAFKPEFEKTAQVMSLIAGDLQRVTKALRGMQWEGLPEDIRKQVKRSDVETLMSSFDFEDMRSAATHYITKNRPDLLSKLVDKAKEDGERSAANRKRFRFGQQRSNAPASRPDTSWQKYLAPNGEIDQKALNRLTIDDRLKVLDQIEKATKPK